MTNNLPLNWCECKLENFVQILDGNRKPINSVEREQRIANAKMLYPYYGATGQVGYIDDYLIEGSYVLLGEDGAPFLEPFKKKAYIVDGKIWVNNHAHILKGYSGISDKFICYWLNSISYREYVSGTTRLKLNQAMMREIKCKLPPLAEQERIVEKIEALFADIDTGVEKLKATQAQIKQYRQSVLKSAFEGKLYKTTEWEKTTLGKETTILGDGLHGTPEYNENGEYFFINGNNLSEGSIIIKSDTKRVDKKEYDKYKKELGKTTVLVSINGTLGNLAFYNNEKIVLGKSACYFNVKENLNKKFIYYKLKTNTFLKYANLSATGSTIKNVSLKSMRDFPISLPSLPEQQRIVTEIEKRFAVADELEKAVNEGLEKADKLKQSILKKAFEGKLVAQNPNDEPASVLLARIKKSQTPTKGKKK